ncbi:ABC transporter permease [Campylobacter sp. MIT 12-8780]|uniref:ABC transporter permease n=1 Tax=unclassified Campylobacter TaxID=2593542 RepID=UPI00115CC67B|nr:MULTISPECIES: ABC transporter permease [unclassified Campylobacter]NDJ26421.1 ABC transporter permease [Campylobacter sp. MIT 19-121]TQR42996.1 ABC transporter permease [Campylobacter sp. MIT 12-8780]
MRAVSLVFVLLLLILWQFINLFYQSPFIPSPLTILESIKEFFENKSLLYNIYDSLKRFIIGFCIASLLGIFIGLIFGYFKKIELLFEPLIAFFRPISALAFFPLIVLYIGIGDKAVILVIVYAMFFPLCLLCISAVRSIAKEKFLMAKNFGASSRLIFTQIIIPETLLHIASGLKIAASLAWINLVAGEMLGVQSGLGYMIIDGRNLMRMDMVFVGIFFIGLIGILIHWFFAFIEFAIKKRLGKI